MFKTYPALDLYGRRVLLVSAWSVKDEGWVDWRKIRMAALIWLASEC
jgi:hypothetical protein